MTVPCLPLHEGNLTHNQTAALKLEQSLTSFFSEWSSHALGERAMLPDILLGCLHLLFSVVFCCTVSSADGVAQLR